MAKKKPPKPARESVRREVETPSGGEESSPIPSASSFTTDDDVSADTSAALDSDPSTALEEADTGPIPPPLPIAPDFPPAHVEPVAPVEPLAPPTPDSPPAPVEPLELPTPDSPPAPVEPPPFVGRLIVRTRRAATPRPSPVREKLSKTARVPPLPTKRLSAGLAPLLSKKR